MLCGILLQCSTVQLVQLTPQSVSGGVCARNGTASGQYTTAEQNGYPFQIVNWSQIQAGSKLIILNSSGSTSPQTISLASELMSTDRTGSAPVTLLTYKRTTPLSASSALDGPSTAKLLYTNTGNVQVPSSTCSALSFPMATASTAQANTSGKEPLSSSLYPVQATGCVNQAVMTPVYSHADVQHAMQSSTVSHPSVSIKTEPSDELDLSVNEIEMDTSTDIDYRSIKLGGILN